MNLSSLSVTIYIVASISSLATIFFLAVSIKEIFTKKRHFNGKGINGVVCLILGSGLMGGLAFCLYNAPKILFNGVSWEMVRQSGPSALIDTVLSLSLLIPLLFIYFMVVYFFEKPKDKPFFMMIVLSVVSGVGNSFIIFIINNALARSAGQYSRRIGIESGLYLYYLLGILLFLIGAYIVRRQLIAMTNQVVYEMRMSMIQKLLRASFYKFEEMENSKIFSALNNDSEVISNGVHLLVNFATCIVMLVTCFIYLGALDLLAMLLSIIVIVIASLLFLKQSQAAEKYFEKNRDYQNIFFKNITDLVTGFKELYINFAKRNEFHYEIKKNSAVYRDTRISADNKFVGVTVFGGILYLMVIGVVVFIFPYLFSNFSNNTMRDYVVVYLFMGNIINMQIYEVNQIFRILVSWRRINSFNREISDYDIDFKEVLLTENRKEILLEMKDIVFTYKNRDSENFSVGPIDYTFNSGEIIFITGGNGSGKSTFAKLISGLYLPDEGNVTMNGESIHHRDLSNYFTTVYSDFHIFDKVFGVDCKKKEAEIEKYLKLLRIEDKVSIKDGVFSTLKLSTGQKKRLALLISYLEDKPIFLFDEWTANLDPEFREFFYNVLLPGLKEQNKLVIAITHDDRYFKHADKIIKMDAGRIVANIDEMLTKQEALAL